MDDEVLEQIQVKNKELAFSCSKVSLQLKTHLKANKQADQCRTGFF